MCTNNINGTLYAIRIPSTFPLDCDVSGCFPIISLNTHELLGVHVRQSGMCIVDQMFVSFWYIMPYRGCASTVELCR